MTEPLDPHRVNLRGTQSRTPRCAALTGTVGKRVACSIYPLRPSPCHELQPAWRDGLPSPQCDRARQAHGLPPLLPEDWIAAMFPSHAFLGPVATDLSITQPAVIDGHVPTTELPVDDHLRL